MRMSVASLALVPCLLLAGHASAQSIDRDGLYGFVGVGSHSVSIPASNVKPQYRNAAPKTLQHSVWYTKTGVADDVVAGKAYANAQMDIVYK